MELASAIAAVGYFGLNIFVAVSYWREREQWRVERADLLNRIMARNYNEFVHTVTTASVETPQMTTDEAEAKWSVTHESADEAWHEENRRQHPELYPDDVTA